MVRFLVRLVCNAIAIWVATYLVTGITLAPGTHETSDRIILYAAVALIFTIINAIIKPILVVFSMPVLILTLGIFYFIINAFLLLLTAWLSQKFGWGFSIDGFGAALIGSIIVSIINMVLSALIPERR